MCVSAAGAGEEAQKVCHKIIISRLFIGDVFVRSLLNVNAN